MNKRAFILGAAMVLLCNLVAVTLRSYAEASFLAAYGAQKLPWLLIANAAGFAVATFAYDLITRRAHTRIVDVVLLGLLFVAAALAPKLLDMGASPVLVVVALAAASQVAGLALWNRVAASVAGRDARRMLPRAGAAVTLGGAIAGLGAGVLVYRVGLIALPIIGAVVTIVVLVLAIAQDKALAKDGAPGATAPAGTPEALAPVQKRLLRALIVVAILEGIVATVIDLQFIATLKGRYSGDSLAVAITLFYGGTNAILFVLQVSAVPRILVTRSLPTTAAIHPVLAIAWYALFVAAPGFIIIAGTRTTDQILRLATSRTSQEIELSAFPPGPRARWKVLLRGGMWPLGAALAALVLLLVGPVAIAHPNQLAAAAVGIAILWFVAAQIAARRFQTALAAPLNIRSHRADDLRRVDLDTLERWAHIAGGDDPRRARLARAAMGRARVAVSDLEDHLRHEEASVRAALYEQLARAPTPELRNELRAAVIIEDDDRALALGLKALALGSDSAEAARVGEKGLERGRARAALSREVAEALQSAERTLSGEHAVDEIAALLGRDPEWAVGLARAHRTKITDAELAAVLLDAAHAPTAPTSSTSPSSTSPSSPSPSSPSPSSTSPSSPSPSSSRRTNAAFVEGHGGHLVLDRRRAGAFLVIARIGPDATMPALGIALEAGVPGAIAAIATLDADGATHLGTKISSLSPIARTVIARALAGAPSASALVSTLISDDDPEVAHAALRTALAIARGGGTLPEKPIADAVASALAALEAHLDARDAAGPWSACARLELELATPRCVVRLLWAVAVEAAASGRDPATLAATARHLIGGKEPDRRRALDVVQEMQTGRTEILAVLERWLKPAVPATDTEDTLVALSLVDPWLASLGGGELTEIEPRLSALRKAALFATMAGPALAAFATQATQRELDGPVFAFGDPGDTMLIVIDGAVFTQRPNAPSRRVEAGGVVGELAVLTRAPRAASVTAEHATVLEIDRATFSAAARRAPELVLGLSATLAGWIAPERPDVLG
ncbi:MAG: cyclic nucleotide-binding domain-containing protein [Kofleriaceae bacterium]